MSKESRSQDLSQSLAASTMEYLASLSEKDLQRNVIEPLLRERGFTHVRDVSGPSEKGKDLIAVKEEFGKTKLYGVQIKKFKFSGKVGSSQSIVRVLDQLDQLMREPSLDPTCNLERPPDRGLFITPYPISRPAFEASMQRLRDLERREITIVDGPLLVDQVLKYLPEMVRERSLELQYRMKAVATFNKVVESSAFGRQKPILLNDIYVEPGICFRLSYLGKLRRPKKETYSRVLPAEPSEVEELRILWSDILGTEPRIWQPPRSHSDRKRVRLEEDSKVEVDLRPVVSRIGEDVRIYIAELATCATGVVDSKHVGRVANRGAALMSRLRPLLENRFVKSNWPQLVNVSGSQKLQALAQVSVSAIVAIKTPVLVTGEPGAGKTTLLRRMAQQIAEDRTRKLPILLPLVSVENESEAGLLSACREELRVLGYRCGRGTFMSGLKSGRFHLLLDGLDEAGSRGQMLAESIKKISEKYRKCPVVVSCREAYPYPKWDRAMHLHLSLFSDGQLNVFIEKWFRAEPTARASLKSWLSRNPKMRDAARTPVVTAVLCSLHDAGADMPATEVELYEERFSLLLGKWERAKDISPLPVFVRRKYWHFLMKLAFRLHLTESRMVDYKEACGCADRFVVKPFHRNVDALVKDCLQRNLLAFNEHGQLSFGHLTYQEYLAARWLTLQNPVEFIIAHIDEAWWRKVFEFYACRMQDITRLVEAVLDTHHEGILAENAKTLDGFVSLAPLTEPLVVKRFLDRFRHTR